MLSSVLKVSNGSNNKPRAVSVNFRVLQLGQSAVIHQPSADPQAFGSVHRHLLGRLG